MSRVIISWEGSSAIGAYVIDYSSHGIRVIIPSFQIPIDIPKEKCTVMALMPIDEIWFTGTCIYATDDSSGFISMGIYFHKLEEQQWLEDLLSKTVNEFQRQCSFVSYEWEESLAKLSITG